MDTWWKQQEVSVSKTKAFIFLIVRQEDTPDSIQSSADLARAWHSGEALTLEFVSRYAVEIPEGMADFLPKGFDKIADVAYSILLGEAMEDDWSFDKTISAFIGDDT